MIYFCTYHDIHDITYQFLDFDGFVRADVARLLGIMGWRDEAFIESIGQNDLEIEHWTSWNGLCIGNFSPLDRFNRIPEAFLQPIAKHFTKRYLDNDPYVSDDEVGACRDFVAAVDVHVWSRKDDGL